MTLAWHSWGGVVLVFTASLPLWALVVWSRARCPRGATGGGVSRWHWRRPLAEIGMVAGSLPWLWMVMTPVPGEGGVRPVPLVDLYEVLHRSPGTATVQVVGNLLVFGNSELPSIYCRRRPSISSARASAIGLNRHPNHTGNSGQVTC